MSRDLSSAFDAAINAQETGEVYVILLTITHDDLASDYHFSSDPTARLVEDPPAYGTTSNGQDFDFIPFQLRLPDDRQDGPPRAEIAFDNTMRTLVSALRSTTSPASVQIDIVLASDPDTVEVSMPAFQFQSARYDRGAAVIDLVIDALQSEPFPAAIYSPAQFPGLF